MVGFIQNKPISSLIITLLLLFLYQCLNLFWGFEVLDSGFHLIAFQNIFDAPNSVTYNFIYYLTNIIGGIFLRVFPEMGIFHFRVVGSIIVLLSVTAIFYTLRKEIPVIHLCIGSVLVVLCYVKMPYSLNNGIISCFLYVIGLLLLYKGVIRSSITLILSSGIIVGINIFTRVPNILGVGLLLIILFHRKLSNKSDSFDWVETVCFVMGIGVGIGIIILLMIELDHLDIFIDSIRNLLSIGSNSKGSHSFLTLILAQLNFCMTNIVSILVFYSLFQIHKIVSKKNKLFLYLFSAIVVVWLFNYVYYIDSSYRILWGMCAVGCLMCIFKLRGELRLFSIIALFMLFVEIMGSDFATNHGSLPALLAAPVASMMIINRKRVLYLVVFVLAVMFYAVRRGNYADDGPIYGKMASINCPQAKFILTTDEKAEAINSTMKGIESFVQPGDTLMCFPAAPIMNYLTNTYPAGGTCWVGSKGHFIKAIEGSPKILFNKFSSFSPSWRDKNYSLDDKFGFDLKSYIKKYKYKRVFENDFFVLYMNE